MKARFSEEYYKTIWNRMLETDKNNSDYLNLEEELDMYVLSMKDQLPTEAYNQVRRFYAAKVVESAEKVCYKMMDVVKRYRAGKCSFGYTTEQQEIHAWYEYQLRFEFNCYQLKVFKSKYIG